MPSITLDVRSAKLVSHFGSDYDVSRCGRWSISFAVKLHWPERLELGTGENIGRLGKTDEVAMRLTFKDTKPELVEWATGRTRDVEDIFKNDDDVVCGTVSYHADRISRDGLDDTPASILFDIYAPPEVMASLVRFAENGRFVHRVSVEVRGMTYGWAPDGSEKKWPDNSEQKILPIVNVSYELPLLEQPDGIAEPGEPTTLVGADLVPILRLTLKWVKGAVWILAMTAIVVVAKGWR